MRGTAVAAGTVLLAAAMAAFAPALFGLGLVLAATGALLLLAWRHPAAAGVVWLLAVGSTLEMSVGDILGPEFYQPIIAVEKGAGLLLALLAVLRFGPRFDWCNPGLAFMAMFAAGFAHGLYPGLGAMESLRSLIGSVAPYAFSFSRLSRPWARAIIRTTALLPALTVVGGGLLDLAGIRPLFVDSGGWRLAALGEPAFLGGFALAAIYACLIELYREGRARHITLMAVNFLILVATGARAAAVRGRGRRTDPGLRPFAGVPAGGAAAGAAGRTGAGAAGYGARRQPGRAPAVQSSRPRCRRPQRPGTDLGLVRSRRRRLALARLGRRRGQCGDPSDQPRGPLYAHLGGP